MGETASAGGSHIIIDPFGWILAAAAAVPGGIVGPRLGRLIVVPATSLAGAYLVLLSLAALFGAGMDAGEPLALLGASFPLTLFATIALISFLARHQAFSVRRRFLR